MRNALTPHVPAFAYTPGDPLPEPIEFDTLADLQEIPVVKRVMKMDGFLRLSISDGRYLMEESDEGRTWWVLGRLRRPVEGLPEWDHGVYRLRDDAGNVFDIAGALVSSSCGDVVTLKDGRKFLSAKYT